MRQARSALACPDAGQGRALEQLELGVAGRPGIVEIADGHSHAATDDRGRIGRRGRQRIVVGCRTDDPDGCAGLRHPAEQVPGGEAKVDDDRPRRRHRLGAVGCPGDHRGDPPCLVALEPDELLADRHDRLWQVHACGSKSLGSPRSEQPVEVVALADGLELGHARRDEDLVRLHVKHPARRPGDDRRAGIDADDLVSIGGVEDQGIVAIPVDRPSDDDPVDPAPLDRRGGHRDIHGQWRVSCRRMPLHGRAGPRQDLTGPRVGDAVDDRHAVPAVAGKAQGATSSRRLPGPDDRDGQAVAVAERQRSAIDDDPAGDLGDLRRSRRLGHARIRRPCGSNSGSGWIRAGRRRPMISISKPRPPGPSGAASPAGT